MLRNGELRRSTGDRDGSKGEHPCLAGNGDGDAATIWALMPWCRAGDVGSGEATRGTGSCSDHDNADPADGVLPTNGEPGVSAYLKLRRGRKNSPESIITVASSRPSSKAVTGEVLAGAAVVATAASLSPPSPLLEWTGSCLEPKGKPALSNAGVNVVASLVLRRGLKKSWEFGAEASNASLVARLHRVVSLKSAAHRLTGEELLSLVFCCRWR